MELQLELEASPARTANGQPRPPQRPDSEGGDLSAEGREGKEGRKTRASWALLQWGWGAVGSNQGQGRGSSCSEGSG